MTPTELEILRRHAKPGHEEALVDIVTLIVERAMGYDEPVPEDDPTAREIREKLDSGQGWAGGGGGGAEAVPWAEWADHDPRTDARYPGVYRKVSGAVTTLTDPSFLGIDSTTEVMCQHGRPAGHMCPHCMGISAGGSPQDCGLTETIVWDYNVHPTQSSGGPVHVLREVRHDEFGGTSPGVHGSINVHCGEASHRVRMC